MAYTPSPWPDVCEAGPTGTLCAATMSALCAGATGQYVLPECATVGCPVRPRSALLDPRSGCSAWRRAVELDDTERWNARNQCVVSVSTSITEHCVSKCGPQWTRGFGRGAGYVRQDICERNASSHWWKPTSCERCGLLWYPKCPADHRAKACVWCEPACDAAPECTYATWTSTTASICAGFGDGSPGAPYLDAAIRAYCASPAGAAAPECACANFGSLASDWCARGTLACPTTLSAASASELCMATEFGMQTQDAWEVVQFAGCDPYVCWYAPCTASPEQSLVPSALRRYALSGSCSGVCIQARSSDSTSFPAHASPLPPGAVQIGASVLKCGAAQNAPASLSMPPLNAYVPANARFEQTVMLANDGDYLTTWEVATRSADWIAVSPPSGVVGSRGSAPANVLWDRAELVRWGAGSSHTATVTVAYDDGTGKGATSDLVFTVVVGPSVAPDVVTVTSLTTGALGLAAGLGLGGLVLAGLGIHWARAAVRASP